MKDTYSCGHAEERRGGIMIDAKIDKPCPACQNKRFDPKKAKQAIDRMADTPPKALYAEVLDTISLLEAEGFKQRAKRLSEALWPLVYHAVVNGSCDRAWYASEPCRRPRAADDGHECGEVPGHNGSCRCKCGEVCFK